jgi:ATP-dependent DNA helicase RecQ
MLKLHFFIWRLELVKKVLKNVFGFDEFRVLQKESIDTILEKKDLLTILPTGGGKSLCYQLPALLCQNQVCVVISPLIALIYDQVQSLKSMGVKADMITSNQDSEQIKDVYKRLYSNEISLLYVSPERANLDSFKSLLHELDISFFVIDEAHCISEWGHEFRPDYRTLSFLKDEFPDTPIASFTATATAKVANDIVNSLNLKDATVLQGSFLRKNLMINVLPRKTNGRNQLLSFLNNYKNESGIIYAFKRKDTEDIAKFLKDCNIDALAYHAGLDKGIRDEVQDKFIKDEVKVIVATVAFGMGIDKSNVRFVVHMDLPKSIESYYQEIGRAGRDMLTSECLLLYTKGDLVQKGELIEQIDDLKYRQLAQQKINLMYRYAVTEGCRHKHLVEYFGEVSTECKEMCDNCKQIAPPQKDASKEAQMVLSTIYRTEQSFGKIHIINVLRGSKNKKVLDNGHDKLSVYKIGKEYSKYVWEVIIDRLLDKDALKVGENRELLLTNIGKEILKGKEKFFVAKDVFIDDEVSINETKETNEVFDKLRDLRQKISKEENIPAYIVFSDATLKEMSDKLPTTKEQMLAISGIGEVKFERYGETFLEFLLSIKEDNLTKQTLTKTYLDTLELVKEGKNLSFIAKKRDLKPSTILYHIDKLFQTKKITDEKKSELIEEYLEEIPLEFQQWYYRGKDMTKDNFLDYLYFLITLNDKNSE